MTQTLGFVACLAIATVGCSNETDTKASGVVDIDFRGSVEIDFRALEGDSPAGTQRGDIVFDLRKASDFESYANRVRCVGLDPFASTLQITRLEAEGLESFLDVNVQIAPYPNGEWTHLADFASLVSDQSTRGFDDPGFIIYFEGLDVLEDVAFRDAPQFEIKVTSIVPERVLDLQLQLDLALILSSEAGACPGPSS